MKRIFRLIVTALALTLVMPVFYGCNSEDERLNVTITIWHYYNDVQKNAFEQLITEFNETVGASLNITAISEQKGASTSIYSENVLKSAEGKIGSPALADMFLAYPDTAKAVNKLRPLADLSLYFTKTELSEYNPFFLEEGKLDLSGTLKNFPIAKSTEILTLNKTEWDNFAASVPQISLEMLSTIEGLIEASRLYYEYSDGKAFYSRDSLANYFIIGAKQFGVDLFGVDENDNSLITVSSNKAVIKKLWDSYYVPYLKGYFAANARFRTDDLKNKTIVAGTGSSASASYTPTTTIDANGESPTEFIILANPYFEGQTKYAFQQGAGISVLNNDNENVVKGCVEFLKWFTDTERNIEFALTSAYMPVKNEALNMDKINEIIQSKQLSISAANLDGLGTSIGIINEVSTYTSKPFSQGNSARNILDASLNMDTLNSLRQNVLARASEQGITETQALDSLGYISEAAFESWYQSLCTSLNNLLA